ncbi:MAG: hypothetical protein GXO70_10720 [Acidobacteria bacterium]|nr:hypothetical protein [Acidobacteriota bacterium]
MATKSDDLAVFTHSIVHRTAAFFIVGLAIFFYLKQFKFVTRFYRDFLSQAQTSIHSPAYILAIKTSLILGLIAGFLVVCLTIYTLVDVWGLKIMVTECSVIVINTLFPFPGTGEMLGSEIVEMRKGAFRFHLIGEKSVLSFSGVDRIDRLFYLISECKRRSRSKMPEK